jgi:drug/metabolite transporter (DMT)-like permease
MRTKSYFCDLLLLSAAGVWGFNFAIIKLIYNDFNPIAFNALRFAVCSMTMAGLLWFRGESLRVEPEDRQPIFWLAVLSNAVYQFLFVIGLEHTKAGNAGLLMALTPVFAYIVGVFSKRETFSHSIAFGIVLSLAGVSAIVLAGSTGVQFSGTWKGDLLLTAAAFCWGWYTGASTELIRKYGALRLTVLTMIGGTAIMIPLSIPWMVRQDWFAISRNAWAGFFYSAMLSIVYGYLVWAYALRRIGVARTAVFSNVTPIIALFGGWWLIGEVPTTGQIVGVICVLSGVFIVRSYKHELE